MNISLDDLLKGKATKIKNKEYAETEAYVTPFLERLQSITNNFQVKVELPNQMTITKDHDINFDDITYNRVWIQAVLPPEYQVDNHDDVLGMIYGLDTRKPIVKFYRGGLNEACTNLCVFNPSYLSVQELEAEKAIHFNPLDSLINKTNEIKIFLDKLHNKTFSNDELTINENLGKWIRNCIDISYDNGLGKAKLATSTVIDAYKLLFKNTKSPYYINNGTNSNYFNIYNAFTQLISHNDKDIMTTCEKTLLLNEILEID